MSTDVVHHGRSIRPIRTVVIVLIVVGASIAIGLVPRIAQEKVLKAGVDAGTHAATVVEVTKSKTGPQSNKVNIPGTIEAWASTAVNARTTGYAEKVLVNIGDRVKSGQVLATVTAPDADQEVVEARAQSVQSQQAVMQARATLAASEQTVEGDRANVLHAQAEKLQASAILQQTRYQLLQAQRAREQLVAALNTAMTSEKLARIENHRYTTLAKQGFSSQETADQYFTAYQNAEAATTSARAAIVSADAGIQAAQSAVAASADNVREADADIRSSMATVASAVATVNANAGAVSQAQSSVQANFANLQRLTVLQKFETIRAPFSGVITARNIDPGAFITDGNSGATAGGSTAVGVSATGSPATGASAAGSASNTGGLFTIADCDTLRIYFNLPQNDAALLKVGSHAIITVRTLPGRTFDGVVAHSTAVLDSGSRTLVAEVDMPNPGGILRPGMFSMVQTSVPQPPGVSLIPDSALVTGQSGTQVILVDSDNKLHFQKIQVGDDNGQDIEVLSGLAPNVSIVSAPSNGLTEGEVVQPVQAAKAKGS